MSREQAKYNKPLGQVKNILRMPITGLARAGKPTATPILTDFEAWAVKLLAGQPRKFVSIANEFPKIHISSYFSLLTRADRRDL